MASSSSSRLRARIARGDDIDERQLASVTESFVQIGTPLPALVGKGSDPNEGKPLWEQEVRDEQGRRRFHGAFTGGWSAGYYNTVGSKEGWTPQTFVSSRKKDGERQAQAQRPEDFMDEEDLAHLDETRTLSNKTGYQDDATSGSRHAPGDVLGDLLGLGSSAAAAGPQSSEADTAAGGLVAPPSSLGHKILTRMGWKAGNGLGALVTAKRRGVLERMYGLTKGLRSQPASAGGNRVPPPDTPMPAMTFSLDKRDTHGLGWTGGNDQNAASAGVAATPGPAANSRRGFDISVLEEADEDDVNDIYSTSESAKDALHRRKATRAPPTSTSTSTLPGVSGSDHRWRDGKALPAGFVVVEGDSIIDDGTSSAQTWLPPRVPDGWQPDPLKVWSQAKAGTGPPPSLLAAPPPLNNGARQPQASDRAQMLGEAPMPGPPPSLSAYMPAKAAALSPPPPTTVPLPRIDASVTRAGLRGFIPFGNDPAKQKRYVAFLESCSSDSPPTSMPVPTDRTRQQVLTELDEFARSASIFKGTLGSSAMSSRFASAQTSEGAGDVHAPAPGLYQPTPRSKDEVEAEKKRKEEEEREREEREKEERRTDEQRAAKTGLFGVGRTRVVKDWFPPRLLCKRLGVKDPHPDRSGPGGEQQGDDAPEHRREVDEDPFSGGGSKKQEKWERSAARREIARGEERFQQSRRELMGMVGDRPWEQQGGQPIAATSQGEDEAGSNGDPQPHLPKSLEQVGLGEGDEEQLKAIESFVKPARDIFKSVFESDEEEEEDEQAGASATVETPLKTSAAATATSASIAEGERPIFMPRSKRHEGEEEPAAKTKKRESAGQGGGGKKIKKVKASKGALTFSLDGDGEEEEEVVLTRKPKKAVTAAPPPESASQSDKPAPTGGASSRMKASDLF